MAEQDIKDKYIKCSKCRCKYINDDDHIKTDFGHNRLNERYKTCVACRGRTQKYNAEYREKQLAQPVDADHKCCSKCYQVKPITDYSEYKKNYKQQCTYTRCIRCRDGDKRRVY